MPETIDIDDRLSELRAFYRAKYPKANAWVINYFAELALDDELREDEVETNSQDDHISVSEVLHGD